MLRPYLEKKRSRLRTPISADVHIKSFFDYISNKGRYRKTANAFGIYRASICGIIRKVSYAATTFVDSKLISLVTTEEVVQELTDGYLEAHGFPLCIGTIDGTHIEKAEPREPYSGFINRKGYFSLNVLRNKYFF